MSNKRTKGYIVVGRDGQPLTWSEGLNRFIRCLFSMSTRWTTNIFEPWEYERVRNLIRRHYREITDDVKWDRHERMRNFTALRIVRLVAAEPEAVRAEKAIAYLKAHFQEAPE